MKRLIPAFLGNRSLPLALRLGLVVLTLLFGAHTALAGQEAEMLGPDQWPTTLDAVVADILVRLPEADKEQLKQLKREDLIRFHFGWGTAIRNHYGLWRGNRKLLESACGDKPCHPDDASMVIIEKVWETLKK